MNELSLSSLERDEKGLLSGQYWGELRIFAEVARAKSFNRAAERLGLSQPTIARKVRRLQDVIGAQLFVSTKHGVSLTERGEELAAAVLVFDQSLFSIASDLKARAKDAEGIVRLSITDGLAAFFAAPALPAFSARHPKIQLHLQSLSTFNDLRENQTDMMLTVTPTDRADLFCKRLGTLHFVPIATRAYVACHGMPRRDNLAEHLFLQSYIYQSEAPIWQGWQTACATGRIAHYCDNPFAYGMLVNQGLGIGLLGSYASRAKDAVSLDLGIHSPVPLFGVALIERLKTPAARLVFEWLCETFAETSRWFRHKLDMSDPSEGFPALEMILGR